MKLFYQNGKTAVFSILLLLLVCFSTKTMSQTTISTNFAVNNGFAIVTFNFTNGTGGAIIVTDIGSVVTAGGSNDVAAYYKTSAIAGAPGAINAGNGWNQFGTGTINAAGTGAIEPFLSGLSLIIPAGATYGMCVEAKQAGAGNLAYSTVNAGVYNFTGGGCTLTTGTNIGFAGDIVPNAPTFTPRGFIGSISFTPAAPCAGTPAPGNTVSSVPTVCPGINFTLSFQNPPAGSGLTFQWYSSATLAGPYTPIVGATNSNLITTQAAATYYQGTATCSGNTGTSTPVQVLLTAPSGCYCIPPSTNCNLDDVILHVLFEGIDKTSDCSPAGYSNYSNTDTAVVVAGGTYPMSVDVGPGGTEYVGVWIDADQSGSFEPSEFTALGSANGATINGNVTIPVTALTGTTRMRLRVRFNTANGGANACTGYTYGETEDYAITINPCIPVAITTQPADATIECGTNATFTVDASGSGPAYKWQERTSASAFWTDLTDVGVYSGTSTGTLTITGASSAMNGYQYRAVYSGFCKAIDYSDIATLTVDPLVAVVDPPSADICNGSSQQLSITNTLGNTTSISEGFDAVLPAGWATKQNSNPLGPTAWYQGDNVNFFDAHSGAGDSYIAADYANTDPLGIGTISNWLISPAVSIKNGDIITFWSRIPAGTEYPDRLELRISANGNSIDVGNTETSVGDFTNVLLTINPTLVTGVYPKVWTQFTATVSGLAAPTTGRIAFRYFVENAGGNAPNGDYIGIDDVVYTSVGSVATGVWTGPAGTMFTDAGLTTAYTGTAVNSIYVNPTATTTYSVVVTTPICVSDPTEVPVNVSNPIGTVTGPANATICTNDNTSFTVSAASGNDIEYQWQESTDGGATWNDLSNNATYGGTSTATLTLTAVPVTFNNNKYRAVLTVTTCSSTVTSPVGTLTVNPLPIVVINAGPYTQIHPGQTTTLTAAVSPNSAATYQWLKDGVVIPGATSATLVVDVDALGEYSVNVSDVNGCAGTSVSSITVSAASSDIMFIYPSPTTGQFQVRYQSANGNALARTLTIYDSKGGRVYSKSYNINAPYGKMDVDMSGFSKGIYMVELGDLNGKRLKTGTVVIL